MPVELDFLREKLLYNNDEFDEYRTIKKDLKGKVMRDKDGNTIPTEIFKFPSQKLFESYCDWRKNVLKAKDDITSKAFKIKVEQFESYGVSHIHDADCNAYVVNRDKLKTELYKDFDIDIEQPTIPMLMTFSKPKEEEKKEPEVVQEEVVVAPKEVVPEESKEVKLELPPPSATSKKFIIPKMSKLSIHDPNYPQGK
jgi:hypothetical protein